MKGAAFEGLLEQAASEGKKGAGQYFTPSRSTNTLNRARHPCTLFASYCRTRGINVGESGSCLRWLAAAVRKQVVA